MNLCSVKCHLMPDYV